ncbi:hypothetical protein N431DRAFT_510886 [Stipitochalara longipes BDJ]|nr:hypothetical protein N431DRAFT_510886 [Stipitochalara longipes BDJ]
MAKSKSESSMPNPAKFHFVISTPAHTLDKHDRKAIKSHATKRAHAARRQPVQLSSWLTPDRKLGSLKQATLTEAPAPITKSILSVPIQRRVGSDFSGLQLPSGVEPSMIQDLVKLIDFNGREGYPYEICLQAHPVERGWFPYMISDACCLHSMLFSLRAFIDGSSPNQLSRLACFHYAQTLQLLQSRLYDFEQTSAISDATIMVVVTLATVSGLTGDFLAVENHIKGLEKIVSLRGGLRALTTHNNMQVKVCRADLAYAFLSGHQPLLLNEGISWDCFIADRGLIQCSHQPNGNTPYPFADVAMDPKLYNAWKDLHAFSCIINVAYQTGRKLSPDTYNEMMISVLYRLTYLSFENNSLHEAIRVGLLIYSAMIFMQRYYLKQSYDHLLNLFYNTLLKLRNSTSTYMPVDIELWFTLLAHVVENKEPSPQDWRSIWLNEVFLRAGINSWLGACETLRSVAWVDFIFNRLGQQAYEQTILYKSGTDMTTKV